jgi:hypothetical protein
MGAPLLAAEVDAARRRTADVCLLVRLAHLMISNRTTQDSSEKAEKEEARSSHYFQVPLLQP